MYMYNGFYHGGFGFWGLGWPIMAAIAIIPFWRICSRVGLSPWLSLLLLVPLANLIFVYYLAFADWPSQRGPRDGSNFAPPDGSGGPSAPGR